MFQQIVASGFGTGGFDRGFSEIDLCRLAIRAAKFGPDVDWLVGGGTHVEQKAFPKTQIIPDSQLTFFRGNKGAIRIPSLSFQYLRRPGRTAKLLYFLTGGGFESHRLHQLARIFQRTGFVGRGFIRDKSAGLDQLLALGISRVRLFQNLGSKIGECVVLRAVTDFNWIAADFTIFDIPLAGYG